jgi:hypothetical protein
VYVHKFSGPKLSVPEKYWDVLFARTIGNNIWGQKVSGHQIQGLIDMTSQIRRFRPYQIIELYSTGDIDISKTQENLKPLRIL